MAERYLERRKLQRRSRLRLQLKILETEELPKARFALEKLMSFMTVSGGAFRDDSTGKGILKSPFEDHMDQLFQRRERIRQLEKEQARLLRRLQRLTTENTGTALESPRVSSV